MQDFVKLRQEEEARKKKIQEEQTLKGEKIVNKEEPFVAPYLNRDKNMMHKLPLGELMKNTRK